MSRVSVIIPTYNQASLLTHAVRSAFAQTCRDLDIIVVDDGSEDDTPAVMKRLPECRYFKIAHSGLPAVPRNVGVRHAQGEYIAFLDADDEWLAEKVQVQLEILDAQPAVGLVCSNAFLVQDSNPGNRVPYLADGQGKSGNVLTDLVKDNFVITSTVLMRKNLFVSAGGFSEEPELRAVEDYDLWLRAAASARIHYVAAPLALYRYHPSSISRSTEDLRHWQAMSYIFERFRRNMGLPVHDELPKTIERSLAMSRCAECDANLNVGQYRGFLKALLRFLSKQPVRALKYIAARWVA